ncbi:MAG: hypothetical protein WCE54_07010 [Ignavibacteriaceae bacterium]
MRIYYFFVPFIFLLLIGCSSTYKVTKYFSKEDLYKDANSSMKSRDINVVTVDSSFTAFEGSQIDDDSLHAITQIQEMKEKIPLRETKEIKYFGKSYEEPSAIIFMKNGTELRRNKVKIMPDSIIQCTHLEVTKEYIPLTKIEHISYSNHWIGLGVGAFGGAIIAGVIAASDLEIKYSGGGIEFNNGIWAISEIVIGAIVGAIIGWDNIYEFNP